MSGIGVLASKGRSRMNHQQVPVKVTAWIDEGIAPLVSALNEFADVMTLDSCEGDATTGAYVLFRVLAARQDATAFADQLAILLQDSATDYLLRAEWRPGEDEPLLALTCPKDGVEPLAIALNACRTKLSAGGKRSTVPRS